MSRKNGSGKGQDFLGIWQHPRVNDSCRTQKADQQNADNRFHNAFLLFTYRVLENETKTRRGVGQIMRDLSQVKS